MVMYEDELINEIAEGNEYEKEILIYFIERNNYHLYSKTIGKVFGNGQAICVVNKVIKEAYQCWYDENDGIHIRDVKGIVFAELK